MKWIGAARSLVVGAALAAGTAGAAPNKAPAPSAELAKFASEMATSFDGVFAQVAVAKKHDAAGAHAQAAAAWRGVYEAAKLLTQHAQRAGAAGAFQDPMTFATKAGKLTPVTFLAQLRKLQSLGDANWAKAADRDQQAAAKRARVTYVASIATQVMSLERIAKDATRTSKRNPESAHTAFSNVVRGAAALRTSVTNAAKQKRAAANASYPVTPKPLSATELAARLVELEKSAKKELAAVAKLIAAKPKPVATKVASSSSPTTGGRSAPPTPPVPQSGPAPQSAPAESAAPECAPEGTTNCDSGMTAPCCEGSRCLPGGWVTNGGSDAEGYPTVEPEYFQCQDPDLAPKH